MPAPVMVPVSVRKILADPEQIVGELTDLAPTLFELEARLIPL